MANKRSPNSTIFAGKGGLTGNVRAQSKSRSIWHFPVLAVAFGGTAILIPVDGDLRRLGEHGGAELASANRGIANLARSFAGHVERSLDGIDQILTVVARAVVERGVPDHLSEILGEGVRNDPLFLSLAVVDPEGGRKSDRGAAADPVDHDFLLRQRQRPDGGLLVSVPQTGVRSAQGRSNCPSASSNAMAALAGWWSRRSLPSSSPASTRDSIWVKVDRFALVGLDGAFASVIGRAAS